MVFAIWTWCNLASDVEPDDRAGAPLPNRSKARLRRTLVGIILATGMTWTVASDPEQARGWLQSAKSSFDTVVLRMPTKSPSGQIERAALHPGMPNAPAELGAADCANRTGGYIHSRRPGASENSSTGSIGTACAETPEPAEETQDKSPKRVHAIAAGLSLPTCQTFF